MIKLVSQFDDEKTKISLATPTCGGCCCCCCCCVVSTILTSIVTARCFGNMVETKKNKKIKISKYDEVFENEKEKNFEDSKKTKAIIIGALMPITISIIWIAIIFGLLNSSTEKCIILYIVGILNLFSISTISGIFLSKLISNKRKMIKNIMIKNIILLTILYCVLFVLEYIIIIYNLDWLEDVLNYINKIF